MRSLNVFGYAGALRADVSMRPAAYAVAPLALLAAHRLVRRVIRAHGATVVHAHWVIPGGATAAAAAGELPIVVSLHGSDLFLAERNRLVRSAARAAFRRADRVTACSTDLHHRAVALGADRARTETAAARSGCRPVCAPIRRPGDASAPRTNSATTRRSCSRSAAWCARRASSTSSTPSRGSLRIVLSCASCWPAAATWTASCGQRAAAGRIADRVIWLGAIPHDEVAAWLAAADVSAAPSVVDDAGNVDGLPNTILEALATGTPVVATHAGGIASVAVDRETALVVPERDAPGLAAAIEALLERCGAARGDRRHGPRTHATRAHVGTGRRALRDGLRAWLSSTHARAEPPTPHVAGVAERMVRSGSMLRTALVVLLLAYLPGALLFRVPLLDRARRAALSAEERVFWGVVLSAALSSIGALSLAVAGTYALERLLWLNGAVCLGIALGWRARLRFGMEAPGPSRTAAAPLALLALAAGLFFFVPPSEYVNGGRDPAVYFNSGIRIAQQAVRSSSTIRWPARFPRITASCSSVRNRRPRRSTACGSSGSSSSTRTPVRWSASFRICTPPGSPSPTTRWG